MNNVNINAPYIRAYRESYERQLTHARFLRSRECRPLCGGGLGNLAMILAPSALWLAIIRTPLKQIAKKTVQATFPLLVKGACATPQGALLATAMTVSSANDLVQRGVRPSLAEAIAPSDGLWLSKSSIQYLDEWVAKNPLEARIELIQNK